MGAYRHYQPLASFLADIPFTAVELRQSSTTISDEQVRVMGLQGRDCAYVWLFNSQAMWANMVIDKAIPTEIKGATLDIKSLVPGVYQVQWWHTYEGKIVKQENISLSEEVLRLSVPAFSRDIACKIKQGEHN
jgi:hypothetical protein